MGSTPGSLTISSNAAGAALAIIDSKNCPGGKVLYQVTDAALLARATVWAGSEPAAADEIFNITNGDRFRWRQLWPLFGLSRKPTSASRSVRAPTSRLHRQE